MTITEVLLTHAVARQKNMSPFFFSRFNFDRMKERKNTHYCFHCGGQWGFRLGKKDNAINCKDTEITIKKPDGDEIKVREALADTELEPFLTNKSGYKRCNPGDHDYNDWLDYDADFTFCPKLMALIKARGYTFYRYNPMEKHDPKTHAEAVIGNVNKYRTVWEWLNGVRYPKNFPYVVNVPSIM